MPPTLTTPPRRFTQRIFCCLAVIVALGIVSHAAVLLWARHEFTPVESMVGLEARSFTQGQPIYHDPKTYPYTVAPYGVVFYSISALLQLTGIPPLLAGRFISFLALLSLFWSARKILAFFVTDQRARLAGLLLLAATANILAWGGIGQTDMLACSFSLAAFVQCLIGRTNRSLWFCAAFVLLAVFTKQTACAEIPAIIACLFARNRKVAVTWTISVGTVAICAALTLNILNHGQYFTNVVLANLNPFSAWKFREQVQYFLQAASGLLITSIAGVRRLNSLYIYTATAFTIWLLTAAKLGSELNYQIEVMTLLAVCSAVALDRLQFFPKLFANDPGWVPLLQIPLLLHLVVNLGLTAKIIALRVALEDLRRTEAVQIAPYLTPQAGRVLCGNFDLLVSSGRPIELDPFIYPLLVNAHRINPAPLIKGLAAARFGTIILNQNVFAKTTPAPNEDTLFLPAGVLDQIRQHYVLVRHANSPYLDGDYVYQPH